MHLSEGQPSRSTGKVQRQTVKATTNFGNLSSRLLYVTDRNSKLKVLIGTCSEVSVIPRSKEKHFLHPTGLSLQAANNTKISTYGQKFLTLDFGLRREYTFISLSDDVQIFSPSSVYSSTSRTVLCMTTLNRVISPALLMCRIRSAYMS